MPPAVLGLSAVGVRVSQGSSFRLLLIRLLLRSLAWLPLGALRALGWPLGWVLWGSGSRARRVTERNLELCLPMLAAAERRRLARRRMVALAQTALEVGFIWFRATSASLRHVQRVHGEELLAAAAAAGRGVIVLAPHCGNWELLGLYIAARHPISVMYLPQRDPGLDALVRDVRSRHGTGLAPASPAGVRALLKALKRGELVGILPDQEPRDAGGDYAPFFGVPALTMTLAGNLAARTGALVISGCALRCRDGFEVRFEEVSAQVASVDTHQALAALNHAVERCAQLDLAQYQWEYKRFKSQPDGRKLYSG